MLSLSSCHSVSEKGGTYGAQLVLFEPRFKMLSSFKEFFKMMCFWKVIQSGYEGKAAKNEKNLMNNATL